MSLQSTIYPIPTSKTCLVEPGLIEWKSDTGKWKTEFSIARFQVVTNLYFQRPKLEVELWF